MEELNGCIGLQQKVATTMTLYVHWAVILQKQHGVEDLSLDEVQGLADLYFMTRLRAAQARVKGCRLSVRRNMSLI